MQNEYKNKDTEHIMVGVRPWGQCGYFGKLIVKLSKNGI